MEEAEGQEGNGELQEKTVFGSTFFDVAKVHLLGEIKNVTTSVLESFRLIFSLGFLRGPPFASWMIRMFPTAFFRLILENAVINIQSFAHLSPKEATRLSFDKDLFAPSVL